MTIGGCAEKGRREQVQQLGDDRTWYGVLRARSEKNSGIVQRKQFLPAGVALRFTLI
jgi:hypothetical protein